MGVLRKMIDRDAVNDLWRRAYDGQGLSSCACPVCLAAMREVQVLDDTLHIDVCTRCHMVWFDGGELDAMPRVNLPPPKPELSPKAKAVLAFHKVKQIELEARLDPSWEQRYPDAPWKMLPAILGFPVEINDRSLTHWPVMTWLVGALLVLIHLLVHEHLAEVVTDWGFVPSQALRHQGLTLWSSMLLHGGWFHLLGNLYFLLLAGDDVEDHLGIPRYLSLVLAASAAGCIMHWVGDPRGDLPLVGASGAISGIMAFYALYLPHAQIGLPLRTIGYVHWLNIPSWVAFMLWMGWQLIGVWMQMNGFSNVSALAHLGGALVGFLAWFVWRNQGSE